VALACGTGWPVAVSSLVINKGARLLDAVRTNQVKASAKSCEMAVFLTHVPRRRGVSRPEVPHPIIPFFWWIKTKFMVTLKMVPLREEQSPQIRILEQLAICLVTLLIPASNLTGLVITATVRDISNPSVAIRASIPYCSTRTSRTSSTFSKRRISDYIPGMSSRPSVPLRTAVSCRSRSTIYPKGGGISVSKID
jgi:hypothetical protein